MLELLKSKMKLKIDPSDEKEYEACIQDLARNEHVRSMDQFLQHKNMNTLEHCLYVSYMSFLACRRLGLDYRSAARGALLHDFFLYDWHTNDNNEGLHGFTHPHTALENAVTHFSLNEIEKDIIVKHMWPLTVKLPRYRESFVVSIVDKYCVVKERILLRNHHKSQ
jgi:uncharacterized protein